MAFRPVVASPAYQQVADQIAGAILAGDLPPGEPLPNERDLAQEFDVSRPTIREALRALQARGLVVSSGSRTRPLRAASLAEGTSGPLREALGTLLRLRRVGLGDLVDLRAAVETAAVEAAAQRDGGAEVLREALPALEEMRRPEVSVEEFDEADVRFHLALVAASGNEAMHLVMLAVRDSVAEHLLRSLRRLPQPETFRRLAREHAAILRAVQGGEAARAGRLVRRHIVGFYEGLTAERGTVRSPSSRGASGR